MNTEFVNKQGTPTASEYLSASVEEIIERANKSSVESEIPFVTALFAAKSHQDQKRTSSKMFYVAVITTMIAAMSLGQSYISSRQDADKINEINSIRSELKGQESSIFELKEKLIAIELAADALKAEREEHLKTIEYLMKTVQRYEYKDSKSPKPNKSN
ncbi:hypothetical protein ABF87_03555 [Nitrosomonas sp. JL21]|uniref:hypothetical protein n=1 Tax=Nitrosomonas sp. JL21 TaxID=153949 RepID=UPI00136A7F57|nr:hypothetical protein [Nitrosomonas sp. JL21]MBL8498526.1 hypothetical protein [Nitrosomonas sp.]MCC7092019.1 hypothetical protein [Nitrosomonas sp.]MXS77047.1 hypothetical protein [Nitrosomonas sp. JL21]